MTDHKDDTVPVDEEHPKGALSLMLFYMLVLIGVWVYTYSILLSRN